MRVNMNLNEELLELRKLYNQGHVSNFEARHKNIFEIFESGLLSNDSPLKDEMAEITSTNLESLLLLKEHHLSVEDAIPSTHI